LVLTLLQTTESASACMSAWLSDGEPPAGFSVDRECELKAPDESKATVRYARHQLDIEEVRSHIAAGKQPTRLAMTWDNRVSFMLTDAMQLKKVSFLDVVFEGQGHKDDAFDADAAIATGELSRLLPDLVDALGGELVKA
jgi:recombination associated protein RdgC